MNTSNRQITAAIKKLTGLNDVRVFCSGGVCRFYSDTEVTAEVLASIDTATVYVCALSHQTAKEWAADFQSDIDSEYKKELVLKIVASQQGAQI